MHMLCKKDLSSDEMDTLRRSRNPATVVTANGEVQTNEDAQVYVHDLDLFVAVQLLEDTPAVLSLGKLFEENGSSYEWSRGQKPLFTKKSKEFLRKTEMFVFLVVPGLSSSSGTSSSSTSPPQDSSITSSSPATQRSDKQAPGDQRDSTETQNKYKMQNDKQATGDRLRDLPEWLQEFTENLEDTETPVPAHVSQDSDS